MLNLYEKITNEKNLFQQEYVEIKTKLKNGFSKDEKINFLKRFIMISISIPIFALGVAFIERVGKLGMFPIDSFLMSLSYVSNLSYSEWLLVFTAILITLGILLSKKKIQDTPAYITGFCLNLLVGPIINALADPLRNFIGLTSDSSTKEWLSSWEAWIIFISGIFCQTLGIGMWVASNIALRPYDMLIQRSSDRLNKSYTFYWIFYESIFATSSLIMYFTNSKVQLTLGVGSFIVLVIGGFIAGKWIKIFKKIISK